MKIILVKKTKTGQYHAQVYNTSGKSVDGYGKNEIEALDNLFRKLKKENEEWILTTKK